MGLLRPPHPAGRGGGRFLNWPIPAGLAHLGESCFTSQRDAAPALTKSPVLLDLGKEENRKENEKRKKRNIIYGGADSCCRPSHVLHAARRPLPPLRAVNRKTSIPARKPGAFQGSDF